MRTYYKIINIITKRIQEFEENTKAAIALLAASFLLASLGITAIVVDGVKYNSLSNQVQACANNAVLAGTANDVNYAGSDSRSKGKSEGKGNGKGNNSGNDVSSACKNSFENCIQNTKGLGDNATINDLTCKEKILDQASDVGNSDKVTVIKLESNVTLNLVFSELSGFDSISKDFTASASRINQNLDIAIVFPQHGALCGNTSGDPHRVKLTFDEECKKFTTIKNAIRNGLDAFGSLSSDQHAQDIHVSLIPFATSVDLHTTNVPLSLTENEPASFFNSDLEANFLTDPSPRPGTFPDKVVPLTKISGDLNKVNELKEKIDNLKSPNEFDAWNRTDIGMHTAALMLIPNALRDNNAHNFNNTDKYVILMTDGTDLGCCYTNNPTGNFDNQYLYSYQPYVDHLAEVCNTLKENGVHIFTIYVGALGNGEATDLENAVADCASQNVFDRTGGGEGCDNTSSCFRLKDVSQLEASYAQILASITMGRNFNLC